MEPMDQDKGKGKKLVLDDWENLRWWSRRQIEKLAKSLVYDIYHHGMSTYTPREISTFVELIKNNPSSQSLLPQLVCQL